MWENRQAQQAARVSGLGLMAVSLAACGSSDTTPYSQADVDALESEIAAVTTERDDLQEAIDEATAAIEAAGADDLDSLIAERDQLVDDLEAVNTELSDLQSDYDQLLEDLSPFTDADLTVNADLVIMARGAALEGTTAVLNATDVIFGLGDNELNLTLTAAGPHATINGVDAINVEWDVNAGSALAFDATNVTGATITVGSSRALFDGVAGVTGLGENAAIAGNGVTNFTVAGMTSGSVDAGAADTLSVTTALAANTATVTVNGDVALTIVTATTAAITGTAESVVALVGAQLDTVSISGDDVSVSADTATLGALDLTGAASVTKTNATAAAVDLSGIDAPIVLATAHAAQDVLTLADGASLELAVASNTLVTDGAVDSISITTALSQTAITAVAGALNLSVTDDATITTITAVATDVNLDVAGDVTVTTLTSANANSLTISGSGDVTITNTTLAGSIDASDLEGDLAVRITANGAGEATTVVGTSGANDTLTISGNNTVGTLVVSGIENLTLAAAATVAGAFITGADYAITGAFALTVTSTGAQDETLDLSGLSTGGGSSVLVTGLGANGTVLLSDDSAELLDLATYGAAGNGLVTLDNVGAADTITVTGQGTLAIDLMLDRTNIDLDAETSLANALSELLDIINLDTTDVDGAGAGTGDLAVAFVYNGSTYLFAEASGVDGFQAGDILVVLTNTDVTDLVAASFV